MLAFCPAWWALSQCQAGRTRFCRNQELIGSISALHLWQAEADTASAVLKCRAVDWSGSILHCILQQAEAETPSLGSGAGGGQRSEAELQSQAAAVVRMAQAAAPPQLETESNTDSMRSAWQVNSL